VDLCFCIEKCVPVGTLLQNACRAVNHTCNSEKKLAYTAFASRPMFTAQPSVAWTPSTMFIGCAPHCCSFAGQRNTHPGNHGVPSLVHGMIVRFKYEGVYHLRQVIQVLPADGEHPVRLGVHMPSPASTDAGTLRLIPLEAVSRTNVLQDDGSWTAMGADEAARLLAGQRTLPLHEVRAACHDADR
jgi:hypothetical protein